MKKYTYEARDSANNKIVKSTVQAESENAAAKLLTEQGFAPLKIELQDEKAGFFARWSNRITSKDKIIFTRQLATLIGAGLPLAQSLNTVQEQTANKKMREITQEVLGSVLAMVMLPSRAQLMSSSALVARNWMAARTPVMMNRITETAETKP